MRRGIATGESSFRWLRACSLLGIVLAWGTAFLLVPATLISIDRMTIEVGLAALCVGFVYFLRTNSRWGVYAVLLTAPLVRETGLISIAGYALYLLWDRIDSIGAAVFDRDHS
jgi:hypothetical protein